MKFIEMPSASPYFLSIFPFNFQIVLIFPAFSQHFPSIFPWPHGHWVLAPTGSWESLPRLPCPRSRGRYYSHGQSPRWGRRKVLEYVDGISKDIYLWYIIIYMYILTYVYIYINIYICILIYLYTYTVYVYTHILIYRYIYIFSINVMFFHCHCHYHYRYHYEYHCYPYFHFDYCILFSLFWEFFCGYVNVTNAR